MLCSALLSLLCIYTYTHTILFMLSFGRVVRQIKHYDRGCSAYAGLQLSICLEKHTSMSIFILSFFSSSPSFALSLSPSHSHLLFHSFSYGKLSSHLCTHIQQKKNYYIHDISREKKGRS
jgi:hypothetical protein